MTTPAPLPAIEFEAPLVNPAGTGLYPATIWTENTGPSRFLGEGVRIRPHNYGGEAAFGVWEAEWCQDPADPEARKEGERPGFLDPFAPITAWGFDQCDLTARSQDEVRERARQNLRLLEPVAVEREFAERMLIDAGAPTAVLDIIEAVSKLESLLAVTNTVGVIHAGAQWASHAAAAHLITRSGAALKTPLGHTWVFGGGYVAGLGDTLVATSPIFGWRDEVQVYETFKVENNLFAAVAERSVVVGYEAAIGAATIGIGP